MLLSFYNILKSIGLYLGMHFDYLLIVSDGCDSERASNKFSNKETSPQSSVNANVASQSSRDTENNRTTLNVVSAIDNALKVDPSKGNQFSTETKFSTSFGKRGRKMRCWAKSVIGKLCF